MKKIRMRELIDALNIPLKHETRRTAITVCPVCGREKLAFDFEKDLFNCPACGECGGGVIDAWAVFRGIKGVTQKETRSLAAKDIGEFFDSPAGMEIRRTAPVARNEVPLEREIASIEVRDATYRAVLDRLSLSSDHRKDLLRRGFNDEAIEKIGFRSMPESGLKEFAASLMMNGYVLEGVPGFFKGKDGKWRLIRLPGLLIPVKNGKDQIEGFQIRTKNEKAKYLFLSSPGRQDGTSAKAYAHFADYYGNLEKENRAIVIEGPLKADLVNYFTGIPVFAVPGVSSTKHFEQILPQIKAQGIRRLDVAFDMDYKSNPYVEKALIRMKRMIIQAGFHCNQLVWDPEYKGLDDYLNAMNGMKGEK